MGIIKLKVLIFKYLFSKIRKILNYRKIDDELYIK